MPDHATSRSVRVRDAVDRHQRTGRLRTHHDDKGRIVVPASWAVTTNPPGVDQRHAEQAGLIVCGSLLIIYGLLILAFAIVLAVCATNI